jgi:hypothetical protein
MRVCGLCKTRKLLLYIKSASNGVGICAEIKKSHNFMLKQRQLHLDAVAVFETTGRIHVRVFI